MRKPEYRSWSCWLGAFGFLVLCFIFVILLGDGCIKPKRDSTDPTKDQDSTPLIIEQYDSIMLAKLDSMNRVNRMESIQAQMLMIVWNANPEYRNILRPYIKVYADSLLRQKLTAKDTFDLQWGVQ